MGPQAVPRGVDSRLLGLTPLPGSLAALFLRLRLQGLQELCLQPNT